MAHRPLFLATAGGPEEMTNGAPDTGAALLMYVDDDP